MRNFFPWLAAGLFVQIAPVLADCSNLPEPASAYIKANPGWHIMTLGGWDKDAVAEWHKLQADACPGLAMADLDGNGPSYALLLQRQSNGKTEKKLVAVQRRSGRLSDRLIASLNGYSEDFVVRAKPGRYRDGNNGRRYDLVHDGFDCGSWDSADSIYYLSAGRVKTFANTI